MAERPTAVVRRIVARVVGQPPADTDRLLPPNEVLVLSAHSPGYRAMDSNSPVV